MNYRSQQARQVRMVLLLMLPIIGLPFLCFVLWLSAQRKPIDRTEPSPPNTDAQTPQQEPPAEEIARTSEVEPSPEVPITPPADVTQISPSGPSNDRSVEQLQEELQKQVETAFARFDRSVVVSDIDILAKFGGPEWKAIRTLHDEATRATQPEITLSKLEQAESQLRDLRPQLLNRKLLAELREIEAAGDDIAYLKALSSSRDRSSDATNQFDAMWQEVAVWNAARWYKLCQAELESMAPDDRGFSEIWHAIADYQRDAGNTTAQLEAEDKAWTSLDRMTDATRAAESAIECLHRLPKSTSAERRMVAITRASKLILQISNVMRRSSLMAELSGISGAADNRTAAKAYLEESILMLGENRSGIADFLPDINRCRALSAYTAPTEIFSICAAMPKYNGSGGVDAFPANTLALSYAAVAAAKTTDQKSWWKAVLLAEAQQLDAPDYGEENIVARATLVKADLALSHWRRALISANNLSDAGMRASIIYKIMLQAPDEIPLEMGQEVIRPRPTDWLAIPAIARFVSHHATAETVPLQLIPLALELKDNSARAAVFLGLARHAANLDPPSANVETSPPLPATDLNNARSLLEAAESSGNILQMPLERAWANVWIAACWHRLDQPASYRKACDRVHDGLFECWESYWPNSRTDDYHDSRDAEAERTRIIDCYRTLAEIQAFVLNDSRNAVETCIDTARAAETLHPIKSELRIHLRSVVEAIRQDCGLPPNLMDSGIDPVNNYLRMNLAASHLDTAGVRKQLALIENEGPGDRYKKIDCTARAYAELALLSARAGDIDSYRSARRQSMSFIETQNASDSILLPLYEADAYAGEFEMVMKVKRTNNRLPLYGTMVRPLSTLCVEMSAAGRFEEVKPYLPSPSEHYWRIRAMHGVAAGRLLKDPLADHLTWVSSLEEPIDRVAAYCGLAMRNPRLEKSQKTDGSAAK